MIEILYSGGVEGTLRASHIYRKGDFICTVNLMLDVGYLDEDWSSEYRRRLFKEMFNYAYPTDLNSDDPDCDMGTIYDESVKSIKKMQTRAKKGEPIRIWADLDAVGQCSTAFVCNILSKIDGLGEVYIMYPPQFSYLDDSVRPVNHWSLVCQEKADVYLPLQRKMTYAELQFYSNEWDRMKSENSNLRTVICGRLTSVSEDFFDELVLNCVSHEPMHENVAIGKYLENGYGQSMLIPTWRLQKCIDDGYVDIVEEVNSETEFLFRKIKLAEK